MHGLIGWIYILVRRPYRVDDRIKIGDATGPQRRTGQSNVLDGREPVDAAAAFLFKEGDERRVYICQPRDYSRLLRRCISEF